MTSSLIVLGVVLFIVVATMPVYAVVSRGRAMDAEVQRRPTTVILGGWIRGWVYWIIGPFERAFVRWKVSPDVFNWAGALLGLAAGAAYATENTGAAGLILLLSGVADIFDGRVARAQSLASAYGELLDSTLDRFAETFAYAGLAMAVAGSRIGVLCVVTALGGSLLVSYVRARGQGLGVDFKGGLMQRAERLVLLAVASLLDLPLGQVAGWPAHTILIATTALIGIGSLATAVYRMLRVARELRTRP
jgi:phosphatidylglycerophosphate synthase